MKRLIWVGRSYDDLMELPPEIRQAMGYALHSAQVNKMPLRSKVLSGMGSANVIEIRENDPSGTYRLIYTVEMADFVFVLHVFKKKSKSGIATPKQEIELLRVRLKEAKALYKSMMEKNK